jgi:hypothetical protein
MGAAPNWKGKNLQMVQEACRHGESMLGAQVALATSADQRAAVLAAIFAAVATGIIGAVASRTSTDGLFLPLIVGGSIAAIAYLIGAGLCIFTVLPADFWVPGNDPKEWYDDIDQGTPLEVAVGQQAEHFSAHIAENNAVLVRNGSLFFWGAVIGISAPLIGLFAAGIICLLQSASV